MTPATATSTVWTNWPWPDDVTAFAEQHDAAQYLEPLLAALARLFPTPLRASVELETDPEIRDDRHVTFEVEVSVDDVPDFRTANRALGDELFRIVPAVKVWVFRMMLRRVEE